MPLTPADIHNVEFGKASLGKRGYDENEVDALLDEATHEMIRLLDEKDVLQRRLGADPAPDATGGPGRAAEAEFAEVTAALHRARQECERSQDKARHVQRQLEQARRSAAGAAAAEAPSEPVLAMVQRTADDCLREAHDKSRVVLAEAHERAQRMIHESRRLVDEIDQQASRHQSDALAELTARRTGLLRHIDELTTFAAGYQAALERQLFRQGHLLDGTAGAAAEQGD